MSIQTKEQAQHEIRIRDVVTLTARLAQLLAEEVDCLGNMKIKDIEKLQHEKIFITNALEAQRKLLERNPASLAAASLRDKEDLKNIIEVFNNILAQNHRRLMLAKEVNHKIVSAIKEVVRDHTSSKIYSGDGMTHSTSYETLSVTLDSRI